MQHFDITNAEKFGSLYQLRKPVPIGECALPSCRYKDIYDNYECFTDALGNLFCSMEHAEKFYGLRPANN